MDKLYVTFKVSVNPNMNQDLLREVAEIVKDSIFNQFLLELGDPLVETVDHEIEMVHIPTEEDLKRGEEANDRRVKEVLDRWR